MKTLKMAVKELLLQRDMKAVDLIRKTGIDRNTMYNITSGRVQDVDFETLRLLERGLGVRLHGIKGADGIYWQVAEQDTDVVAVGSGEYYFPVDGAPLPPGLQELAEDKAFRELHHITDAEIQDLRKYVYRKAEPWSREKYWRILQADRADKRRN